MTKRAEDAERRLCETHELAERLSKELESAKRETELRTFNHTQITDKNITLASLVHITKRKSLE